MRVRGEVFSGALRGTPLIEKYYPRLVGLVGFRPFRGTMDVKLERSIDIKPFTSKIIGHVLTDGRKVVTAHLAHVRIRKFSTVYKIMELRTKEKEIVEHAQKMGELAEERFSIQSTHDIDEPFYECWAIQFKGGIYGTDVVELIAPDMIKEKLELGDNDIIEIEFSEDKTSTDKLPDPEGVKAGSSYS
ncbi:MAG: hypothetical protein J4400_02935 [Candidatus Aenigmarchaeota archaeon]|nr:hypothetical protein [Candidatus Aenigmarchaeota archaeon]